MSNLTVLLFLVIFPNSLFCSNSTILTNKFHLSVIHFNDFHDRFEEINKISGPCSEGEECIGGFSRLYETATSLLKARPNSILLNAGDNFGGTLWYSILKWNVTSHFFTKLPTDASTLGNHDFDDGLPGILPYLENSKSPIIISNIDSSKVPEMRNLYNKSIIIERGGKKIGIIGALLSDTSKSAPVGNLEFLNESDSINQEARRLVEEENVFTNILLTHCGYELDKKIAFHSSSRISLIVGGHSHSFLYTGDSPPSNDTVEGPYPTEVKTKEGNIVLIVQASSYTKYLGNITVFYSDNGTISDWSGAPIYLENKLPTNKEIDEDINQWKKDLDQKGKEVLGTTLVQLESSRCRYGECAFGNSIADSMISAYSSKASSFNHTPIAIIHAGGIRAGIEKGNISYYDLATVFPFGNTIDLFEIVGADLFEVLKSCVDVQNLYYMHIYQVSGIIIEYNITEPIGDRLKSILIKEKNGMEFKNLTLNDTYQIILPSYLATSGIFKFKNRVKNRHIGTVDIEVFADYIRNQKIIEPAVEGRIIIYQ